ncbi:MAG: ba3-type cytochrome C oxidase subunit I [Gammaproteobacteria bacterium]|nr:MAG: ba3-type cytochrome C oxidase subunit I [Gammaproteobacteria bacterium]
MTDRKLITGAKNLSPADKRLLLAFFSIAVLALTLGIIFATMTAAGRTGLFAIKSETAYRMLGLHGVTIFFYWLYFVQAGFVLLLAPIYTEGAGGVAWRPLAWLGFVVMLAGLVSSESSYIGGTTLLYDGNPSLLIDDPSQGRFFYLGYVLLSAGLILVAASAIATTLRPKFRGVIDSWSPISFAVVAWSGLLMVSAIAGANAFLPPLFWTLGLRGPVAAYTMSWSVLFHNMHYLPLMATVVLWYVLMENLTGVKSIFGSRFSKIVFAIYMIFVPPTSLYHLFLEPDLAEAVRVVGSLLSLFIAVPTILVFVVIIASLESHARAQGGRGLFGWIRLLPWDNPVMAAVGLATVNLALGGVFAMVLIQEKLAVLLSDTFYVPGYFHFLTVGGVSLTFIATLIYVIPSLTGHRCWRPKMLMRLPYLLTIGLALFGAGGIAAGYHGVPRRIFELSYHVDTPLEHLDAPFVWGTLMGVVGAGSVLMVIVLATYVYALFRMLLSENREIGVDVADLQVVAWGGSNVDRQRAWVGPLSIFAMVAAMYAFTALSFEIMQNVPILIGVGGH